MKKLLCDECKADIDEYGGLIDVDHDPRITKDGYTFGTVTELKSEHDLCDPCFDRALEEHYLSLVMELKNARILKDQK